MSESYLDLYKNILAIRKNKPVGEWPGDLKEAARVVAVELVKRHETPFFPTVVYIEPTNACNSNCVICPRRNMTRPVGYIQKALFESIIDQIKDLGPSEIRLFNFGEPTLHKDLPEMIRYCRSAGLPVSFQSNGIKLPDQFVSDLLDAGLTYMGISVNGLDAEEYSAIRPGHQMATVESNLRRVREIAVRKNKQLAVHINAQILKADIDTRRPAIEAYAAKWLKIADSVSVSGLSLYDNIMLMNKGVVTESHLRDLPRKSDADVVCFEPFDRLVVKWDGRVTVCCADYDAKYVVGDLNNDALEQVWHSDKINAIRDIVKNRRYSDHPLCSACPLFYSQQFSMVFNKR